MSLILTIFAAVLALLLMRRAIHVAARDVRAWRRLPQSIDEDDSAPAMHSQIRFFWVRAGVNRRLASGFD